MHDPRLSYSMYPRIACPNVYRRPFIWPLDRFPKVQRAIFRPPFGALPEDPRTLGLSLEPMTSTPRSSPTGLPAEPPMPASPRTAAAACTRSPKAPRGQRLSARPRPRHPFRAPFASSSTRPRYSCPRGRPLPHPADPFPRGRADRPHRISRVNWASTRTWPRPWRWPTTWATRPSAMPARTCWLNEVMAPYGGFDHNEQTFRIVTRLERITTPISTDST